MTLPTRLGDPHNPSEIRRAPGMAPGDLPIWRRLHPRLHQRYTAVFYNVRMGGQPAPPAKIGTPEGKDWEDLTALRADVVGERPKGWDIIEVKDRPSHTALGQLLSYYTLWRQNPPDKRPVHLVYLTPRTTPDILTVANAYGIEVLALEE